MAAIMSSAVLPRGRRISLAQAGLRRSVNFQEQRPMKGSCRMACAAMGLAILACALPSVAQEANPEPASVQPQTPPASAPAAAPLRLTLQDALDRARKNSTQFQAALTNAALARQDRTQARNALLPTVTYDNSAIYTKGVPIGAEPIIGAPVIFIANNAVHEY